VTTEAEKEKETRVTPLSPSGRRKRPPIIEKIPEHWRSANVLEKDLPLKGGRKKVNQLCRISSKW